VIIEREVDCGALYEHKRRELLAVARSLSDEQLRLVVPATPAWSVHDVVSHLAGIAADLNALRFGSGDADAWSGEQVRARRDRSVEELEEEWENEAPTFQQGLVVLGYEIGSHYVGDLLQHMADVNQALARGRISDDLALVVALDFYLDTFHEALLAARAGTVSVRVLGDEWRLGAGPIVASLTADRFETFRCLGGRRSERQIRAMNWNGHIDQVVALVSPYPLPDTDVGDDQQVDGTDVPPT
jgi:uncharacterized protein (TIGR03083 family)